MDSEQKQSVYNLQLQFLYKFYFQLVATQQIKKKELKIDQLFAAILATQLQSTTHKFPAFLSQYHQFFNQSIDQQLTQEQFLKIQLELNSPPQIYKNSQVSEMSEIFKLTLTLINKYLAAYLQENQNVLQDVLAVNIKQSATPNKQLYQELKNIVIKSNLEILHQFNFKLFGVKIQEVQSQPSQKTLQQEAKIKQLTKDKERLKKLLLDCKQKYEEIIQMKAMQITVLKSKISQLDQVVKKQNEAVQKCADKVQTISSEKSESVHEQESSDQSQSQEESFGQQPRQKTATKQSKRPDNSPKIHEEQQMTGDQLDIEAEKQPEENPDREEEPDEKCSNVDDEDECSSGVSNEQFQFDMDFSQLDDKSTLKKLSQ